jgi:hypothetical protein
MKPTSGRLFARLIRLGRQDDAEFLANIVKARNAVANDNVPPADGMGVDTVVEIRPTPNEIMLASKPDEKGEVGLRFNAKGALIEWRPVDEDGNPAIGPDGKHIWLKPVDRYRHAKGGRRKTARELSAKSSEHAEWFLSLRGTGKMPPAWVQDTRYPSACRVLARFAAADLGYVVPSKLRDMLAGHGVDGTRTLQQCAEANPQATVTRGKTVIANGAGFLSGRTESNEGASQGSFVGAPDAAEMSMIAVIDAARASDRMADVLDMALAGMTMREIAAAKNWGNTKQAERKAVVEVDAAIAELRRAA